MPINSKGGILVTIAALVLLIVLIEGAAINSLQNKLKTKAAEAEATSGRVVELEAKLESMKAAAEVDAIATREMEKSRDETISKLNDVRERSCHIDDGSRLDDRLRELIADAYRVAVCTETDAPQMPAASGAVAP